MSVFDWIQILVLVCILGVLIPLCGGYMAKVFRGEQTILHPILFPLERMSYHLAGVDSNAEMGWKEYLKALLLFNLLGFLTLFLIQRCQGLLPFNPQHFPSIQWPLALNTAMSFMTNTNWQAYAGETTMSYATQMWGLTVQNFLSAATGNAALLALIRGITRKTVGTIGNFWVDMVRMVVYVLLPLSFILSLVLISQGVVQTLSPYVEVTTLEKERQVIPLGPAASQVAIKLLGTNGGGFFAANSAHPFENPNGLTNLLELVALLLIPAALSYTYGVMIGSKKQGWILFSTMLLIWCGGLALSLYSEHLNNPLFNAQPLMEGKETRLGIVNSLLWSVSTTTTANGSVNGMLDSLSPLAGGVALFNIMLEESIFGGVGVGFCNMLMFVLLTVFLCGLMVGRTPEYEGKKIEKREIQWVMVAILIPPSLILVLSGISSVFPPALSSLGNRGPHGLSEILYAFSSTSGNNGSAFSGLDSNTHFYNKTLTLCMFLGRLAVLVPSIAIAGSLATKKIAPSSAGVLSTNTFLFLILLLAVILIVGLLTFFPVLCLGPLVEHFLMLRGEAF